MTAAGRAGDFSELNGQPLGEFTFGGPHCETYLDMAIPSSPLKTDIPGLVRVLREGGLRGASFVLLTRPSPIAITTVRRGLKRRGVN